MTVTILCGPETRLEAILVCHREPLVGAATAAVLERRGVARSAGAVSSLTRLLSSLHRGIDVALVFDSVEENIAELFEALRHRGLATPVLIVSDRATPERTAQVLEWGAAGLLPPSCSPEELCEAVVDAHRGNAVLPSGMRGDILDALRARRLRRYAAQRQLAELSSVERHVLRALSDGMSVTRIAAAMSLSPHTVRSHVQTVGVKLSARGQLRIAATGRGLLAAAQPSGWDLALQARGEEGA